MEVDFRINWNVIKFYLAGSVKFELTKCHSKKKFSLTHTHFSCNTNNVIKMYTLLEFAQGSLCLTKAKVKTSSARANLHWAQIWKFADFNLDDRFIAVTVSLSEKLLQEIPKPEALNIYSPGEISSHWFSAKGDIS